MYSVLKKKNNKKNNKNTIVKNKVVKS